MLRLITDFLLAKNYPLILMDRGISKDLRKQN